MNIKIAGHDFESKRFKQEDGLGYHVYWRGKVPAEPLTTWGRGEEQLGSKPLPIAFVSNSDDAPLPRQQNALEWLLTHLDEAAKRIQAACEKSWSDCYYWEGNEMEDDEEYYITDIRIPPGESPEYVDHPRDPSLPALIVVVLEQDWEVEHGFYVVLDPTNPNDDAWATWDSLEELGLIASEDDEESFGEGTI